MNLVMMASRVVMMVSALAILMLMSAGWSKGLARARAEIIHWNACLGFASFFTLYWSFVKQLGLGWQALQVLIFWGVKYRVAKTPSARQQCWPESFCKSGKFLRQVHYWLKNFRILCNTKYPDNMQSVRMNWKVSGQSKKCPDNLENVSA